MKMTFNIFKPFFVLLFFVLGVFTSYAQYGGGYGGGYGNRGVGGGGGYGGGRGGRGNQDFGNGKPKPQEPDEVAKEETKTMVRKLKLTPEQVTVLGPLNEDYAYQRKELFESFRKNMGETPPTSDQVANAREKMQALDLKKDTELKQILTEEQFTKYQELKAKRQRESQGGGGHYRQ